MSIVKWSVTVASALALVAGPAAWSAVRQTVPACSSTNLPVWSPDGKQIAFVGKHLGHPLGVRAICVANADGASAAPLPHTTCTRQCRLDLIDSPSQLFWVSPKLLLYGDDFRIFTISVGGEPKLLGREPGSFQEFTVDSEGDRVAAGTTSCGGIAQCSGPVTVLSVPSGALVGRIGGTKLDNVTPSISPDGRQVVFVRYVPSASPRYLGIRTASADGSHLRRLVRVGGSPLWSPDGQKIAYWVSSPTLSTLRLVSPQGGRSTTLIRGGVMGLFGWSPDGSQIAFENARQRLEVVDVATDKLRSLFRLRAASSVAWSPNSQELLVKTEPHRNNRCATLWRVPVGGGTRQLLRSC